MSDNNLIKDITKEIEFDHSLLQTDVNRYLQNYEALEYLKTKQAEWHHILTATSGATAVGFFGMPLLKLAGATGAYVANELSVPIDRLVSVMEILLAEFGKDGITITPRVKIDQGIIDLFVRTSDRRRFAFMLRSNGDSKVKWREDRQDFFTIRKQGASKWSELKSLGDKLNSGIICLREEKNPLMGDNNTERKKSFTKAIVLTGKTRIDPNNDPALLVDFGRTKALRVKTEAIFYLVDKASLIDFLRKPVEK
jgi:hypothetical protein